jgi:heparanase 1
MQIVRVTNAPLWSRSRVVYTGDVRFAAVSLLALITGCHACQPDRRVHVAVDGTRAVATVSDRYLSIAIDTAQLVGGDFWIPGQTSAGGQGPVTPLDLTRPRLVALARPLGHAYLRIGGTDADRTFYAVGDSAPTTPPAGYQWILTRAQFDAASAFATALDFSILFTLNAAHGPRVSDGPWLADNARTLIDHATASQAPVAVWELGNEVNAYPLIFNFTLSANDYARDVAAARALLAASAPTAKLAAPASAYWPIIGEVGGLLPAFAQVGGKSVDILTWHFYPQESARCPVAVRSATPTRLLDPDNLDEIDRWADDVAQARASGAPSAEAWLDETSNAQCGGAPGISDAFVSSLWWLDELGKMAHRGTPVVIRQSLTGADYGLLSEPSLDPRPDYFASLLWRRLMGARVLAATVKQPPSLRVYAHCAAANALHARAGAVVVLAINLDAAQPAVIALDGLGEGAHDVYAVTADGLQAPTATVNGAPLTVAADGTPPDFAPQSISGNTLLLGPASYAFALFADADADACH